MKVKCLLILVGFLFFPFLSSQPVDKNDTSNHFRILILNSYHEGYKWSDDIMDGIKSEFSKELDIYDLSIEYMDTKVNISESYKASLSTFLVNKYTNKYFDLIITCDDAAYQFLQKQGPTLFPNTPNVFCGVNYLDENLVDRRLTTGIIESYDIEGTIAAAISINPTIKKIYFINDKTITGQSIEKKFQEYINSYRGDLTFEIINNKTVAELKLFLNSKDNKSMAFFGVYFRDKNNRYYSYDESISELSESTNIPIYGMWEFLLGNGITGGNLTSGFLQGSKAAQYAIEILKGRPPSELPIIQEKLNNFQFDYKQLQKHNISNQQLPKNSKVINQKLSNKKNILVLHSYDSKMSWVKEIERGIETVLDPQVTRLNFDYMDTKRVANPSFLNKIYDHTIVKHANKNYDLIIVTDNNAFTFALKNGKKLFKNTPIIFCGVNNFENFKGDLPDNMTGVVENIDLKSTVSLALQQNNNVKNIYVINDETPTGSAINSIIKGIEQLYPELNFIYLSNINITDLINKVSSLTKQDIILLLSFTKDNSNNLFSYDDAGNIISSNATRPVYVVWDFYLGTGVVGGMVTSGYTQGLAAGKMALQLLNQVKIKNLPIIFESPNRTILDANALNRFDIDKNLIPEDSLILNQTETFIEKYLLYLSLTAVFFIIILTLYIDSRLKILRSKKNQKELEAYASFDQLTKVYSRRKGLMLSQELIALHPNDLFLICFIDLDNLKIINDQYGHEMGDQAIVDAINLIKQHLRKKDILFRYGGDEFVILLANTDETDAAAIFQRLYSDMKKVNLNRDIEIAFSYGLQSNANGIELSQMIHLADKKMYLHKKQRKLEKAKNSNNSV